MQVVFDGSYQGWLTAVYDIYEIKVQEVVVIREELYEEMLFADLHRVSTDDVKANRVAVGLRKKLSADGYIRIKEAFLSEILGIDNLLFQYVQYVFSNSSNIEADLTNKFVFDIRKASQLTRKERHRMEAFVRFKLTKDQLYYAIIEPQCDVLSLIASHFKNRYADQRWLIYDVRRRYGIYYDLNLVVIVILEFNAKVGIKSKDSEMIDEQEDFYQELWKRYFKSVNIESRKNLKLQMQQMPKKYWKYILEKDTDV